MRVFSSTVAVILVSLVAMAFALPAGAGNRTIEARQNGGRFVFAHIIVRKNQRRPANLANALHRSGFSVTDKVLRIGTQTCRERKQSVSTHSR